MTDFTLTGRHVLAIFVSAFAVIISVNTLLAVSAVRTFPGLETKNSYVASQNFDRDQRAQHALNWDVSARVDQDLLTLSIYHEGRPVVPEITQATLGRATHVQADRSVNFSFDGDSHIAAVPDLAPGNWNLRLVALAENGTEFRQRIILRVAR